MRKISSMYANIFIFLLAFFSANLFAQNVPAAPEKKSEAAPATSEKKSTDAADKKPIAVKNDEVKSDANKAQPAKKMVQDASITLQTTITGNQEQPRVLYILPWQSPMAENVDFESLDNEQKAVFGHIEREELRRELESSDSIK